MRAIDKVKSESDEKVVAEMFSEWPFYRSRLSMLDMVFHKADPRISEAYDARLVPDELKHFGEALRTELKESIESLLALTGQKGIMDNDPSGKESMEIRAAYLQPLHYLQIELLERIREAGEDAHNTTLERAMMVTIAGIAIGMRNTG